MCGRYTLTKEMRELSKRFEAEMAASMTEPFRARFNIAPTQSVIVVNSTTGQREIVPMRWGLPNTFDGAKRQATPRFTILNDHDRMGVLAFHLQLAPELFRLLTPGAHVIIASQCLVSHLVAQAFSICERIMQKCGQGDLKATFDEIAKYSVLPKNELDNAYTVTEKHLDLMQSRYGNLIGYEYVDAQQLSDSLIRYIYIAKCENHALPWHFLFYKPKDKWTLNHFTWTDKPSEIEY